MEKDNTYKFALVTKNSKTSKIWNKWNKYTTAERANRGMKMAREHWKKLYPKDNKQWKIVPYFKGYYIDESKMVKPSGSWLIKMSTLLFLFMEFIVFITILIVLALVK